MNRWMQAWLNCLVIKNWHATETVVSAKLKQINTANHPQHVPITLHSSWDWQSSRQPDSVPSIQMPANTSFTWMSESLNEMTHKDRWLINGIWKPSWHQNNTNCPASFPDTSCCVHVMKINRSAFSLQRQKMGLVLYMKYAQVWQACFSLLSFRVYKSQKTIFGPKYSIKANQSLWQETT